jgi:hypothetical protein
VLSAGNFRDKYRRMKASDEEYGRSNQTPSIIKNSICESSPTESLKKFCFSNVPFHMEEKIRKKDPALHTSHICHKPGVAAISVLNFTECMVRILTRIRKKIFHGSALLYLPKVK